MSAAADKLQTTSPTLAQHIANYAAGFQLSDVPAAVLDYAKLCIADTIGIGFASHRYEFAAKSINGITSLAGRGDFAVVGTDLSLPVRDAAMLNGLLMHGLDFDDTHSGAVIHCSTSAVPLMLAAGAHHGATGAQALGAYLLAIETDARIGKVAQGMLQKIGFHPTGLVGVFGCTVGAAYLANLSALQTARAQGVALSMASGSLEFLEDGSWTKRLHPGWAASSAITAAAMAGGDFVAPLNAYEGRYGLYSLYLRDPAVDVSELHADLGDNFEMMKIAIKPYPVCHFNHACIDAMLALREKHDLQPDDIKSVTALIHEKQHDVVCRPLSAKRRPQNDYDAKFSLPFAVSAAAVRGRFTLAELHDDALTSPEILALCDRVSCEHMSTSRYPEFYSGGLVVETRDGRRLEHVEPINRGADSRALDHDAVHAKFQANVSGHLTDAQAQTLWQAVQTLDSAENLNALNRAIGVAGNP
ncbi:MAG: MmgE/PrpD family protein [Gammaproteobacteria bacterium]